MMLLLVLAGVVQAQVVEIKSPVNKAGDVAKITRTITSKNDMEANVNGVEQKKSETGEEKYVYVETVIAKPEAKKKATKLTRAYETAEVTKGDKKQSLSYEKKTMTIEKKDGKYTFTVDGQPVADRKELEKEFAKDTDKDIDELLPTKPVKVGDEWTWDAVKMLTADKEEMPFTFDKDKAKSTAKLVKIGSVNGHPTAVMEHTVTIPLKTMKFGPNSADVKDSTMTLKSNMDMVSDGTTPYGTARMEVTFDVKADLPGGNTLTVKGSQIMEMKAVPVK